MMTDSIYAWQVEADDAIVIGDETYEVIRVADDSADGNYLLFDTRDSDGELTQLSFGPFDTIQLIVPYEA